MPESDRDGIKDSNIPATKATAGDRVDGNMHEEYRT